VQPVYVAPEPRYYGHPHYCQRPYPHNGSGCCY
jgi:hypothetical protein